jgi:putative ABC transport system permease protein
MLGWGATAIDLTLAVVTLLPGRAPNADVAAVSPEIFHTLGLHLLRGRLFAATDTLQSPRVAVINETMARRYFTGRDAVGELFHRGVESESTI